MTLTVDLDDVQGNIIAGYGLKRAEHLLLRGESRAALQGLLRAVVDDVTPASVRRPGTALNLGLTFHGFSQLGLHRGLLHAFPSAFRDRPRERASLLGDIDASAPEHWDEGVGDGTVHALLTVHAGHDDASPADLWRARLSALGVTVVQHQVAQALPHMTEHFGFADGAAQPTLEGVPGSEHKRVRGGGTPMTGGRWQPIKPGEFILGYPDEDGHVELLPHPDLVRNGTYVVYRKLEQDVVRFRKQLDVAASESGLEREHIAAKIVGRWRDGIPLETLPWRNRERGTAEATNGATGNGEERPDWDLTDVDVPRPPNDFRYLPHDAEGYVCPPGAHIRRANPRDSITFGDAVTETGLLSARHRIIRRGLPYGRRLESDGDEGKRGLLFICYNADFERQFELIQRAWFGDGDSFYLGEEQDFLLGNRRGSGKMLIPMRGERPRFITVVPELVVTRGMEYLFAPGLGSLRRLAAGQFADGST